MKGLSSEQAEKLLTEEGLNELVEVERYTLIKAFANQFKNFLIILLILAGAVSYASGDKLESGFIFLIVLLNAFFGLYQEAKAEKSLAALKKMTKSNVRVIRDETEQEIDSRYLVSGDLVYLEEGTRIPADGEIVEEWNLEVNEASLTGESLPVQKGVGKTEDNVVFMGTVATKGRAWITLTATGHKTKFGKIAKTLTGIEDLKTPLQIKIEKLSKQIGLLGIAAAVSVFGLSFVREKSLLESFIMAVSLAVAAVPEGLPAVMTITLAIGVERMAGKKAIVRKLNAIEALGSITLLATDKTGTLTTNKMEVIKNWTDSKQNSRLMLLNGVLCSTASIHKTNGVEKTILGDPTEGALLELAENNGLEIGVTRRNWKLIEEMPFDSARKRMSVKVVNNNLTWVFSKGAPESILSICKISAQEKKNIIRRYQDYAQKGLRTLAFSYKKGNSGKMEEKQTFLGLIGMADPSREEVPEAVKIAQTAGIRVVMITGDSELTARSIGKEIGLIQKNSKVMLGQEIESLNDRDLGEMIRKINIFARTTPEQKFRLVRLFQQQKEVVAVTGDGVNDALALKQADVGVAMGITGTDVAKETADMVVSDDNFATIVTAIEEGRNIFGHIKNSVVYLLACNVGEVLYILSAVFFRLPVLLPLQILYMNLATDGVPALSFAFSPNQRDIMNVPPRKTANILSRDDFQYIFWTGILTAVCGYLAILPFGQTNQADAVTVLFTALVLVQQIILLDIWIFRKWLVKSWKLIVHPIFLLAFLMPFVIHPFLLYLPTLANVFEVTALNIEGIGWAMMVGVVAIAVLEISKAKNINRPL